MLKKILEDGVCPEDILNNITDEDKQLIFLEIRKEQVRKYKLWQTIEEASLEFHHKPNKKGKNVGFFDDSQLVSVLGEREGEKPVEEKLLEEALKKAMLEAEIQIQKELEISNKVDNIKIENLPEPEPEAINTEQIVMKKEPPEVPIKSRTNKTSEQKRQELVRRKSTEIYQTYINHISELEESAKKENEELTQFWKKAEEQAKLDEEQRRKLAEEARKVHAHIHINNELVNTSNVSENIKKPPIPSKKSEKLKFFMNTIQKSNLPKSMSEIKSWFLEHEWNKLRVFDGSTDTVPEWFHGIISREETENLLEKRKSGTFLIRLSDKFQCYVLSYKAKNKIKHILIESKIDSQMYTFFGPTNTRSFQSLAELIMFFQTRPLSDSNCDILKDPCGQRPGQISDYMHLLQPDCASSTC